MHIHAVFGRAVRLRAYIQGVSCGVPALRGLVVEAFATGVESQCSGVLKEDRWL
jgi:hypothetical protein